MTASRGIGWFFGGIINAIVRALALSKIHPNYLTFIGLLINLAAATLFAMGNLLWGVVVVIGAGLFDMVDGRVARETNRRHTASAASSIRCSIAIPILVCS